MSDEKCFVSTPLTGVYSAVLKEDMIDTVTKTHKQYIKAFISELWDEDKAYPYTYVPMEGMVLPLKKGDTVQISFQQNNSMYPILFMNKELDSQSYEQNSLPTSGIIVSLPDASNTLTSFKISDDSYIISTSTYTLFRHTSQQCVLFTKNKTYITADNSLNILANGTDSTINIEAQNINMITTGKQKIGTASSTLGSLLVKIIQDILQLKMYGSPALHQLLPDTAYTNLAQLITDIQTVFE